MSWFDDDRDSKRTLGIRDKQILYRNAKDKCENPACGKKLRFEEMVSGHKKAWSKGGNTTLANSVCLCYTCNKLQHNDSWDVFLNKQGFKDKTTSLKEKLETLNISQLKSLAEKHYIKVKGTVEEDLFNTYRKAPTKKQYISKLATIVSEKDITTIAKKKTTVAAKKKPAVATKKKPAVATKKKPAVATKKKPAVATKKKTTKQ
ncbi:MAG: HNH endonuclease signature motif containing protein [Methanosarcinaceae archaeon]|nr:HNH endonuclease signature motif containing protein [Methanosarcinaceae archaeon]